MCSRCPKRHEVLYTAVVPAALAWIALSVLWQVCPNRVKAGGREGRGGGGVHDAACRVSWLKGLPSVGSGKGGAYIAEAIRHV